MLGGAAALAAAFGVLHDASHGECLVVRGKLTGMDSSVPPPENPYASPQSDEFAAQKGFYVNAARLQRDLRRMRFYCHLSGGMLVGLLPVFVGASLLLDELSITVVAFYWLAMMCANLLAFSYVIVTTWQIRGPFFGLSYAVLMALLGCGLVIGYFVVPILAQSDFDRRYGHLLNRDVI